MAAPAAPAPPSPRVDINVYAALQRLGAKLSARSPRAFALDVLDVCVDPAAVHAVEADTASAAPDAMRLVHACAQALRSDGGTTAAGRVTRLARRLHEHNSPRYCEPPRASAALLDAGQAVAVGPGVGAGVYHVSHGGAERILWVLGRLYRAGGGGEALKSARPSVLDTDDSVPPAPPRHPLDVDTWRGFGSYLRTTDANAGGPVTGRFAALVAEAAAHRPQAPHPTAAAHDPCATGLFGRLEAVVAEPQPSDAAAALPAPVSPLAARSTTGGLLAYIRVHAAAAARNADTTSISGFAALLRAPAGAAPQPVLPTRESPPSPKFARKRGKVDAAEPVRSSTPPPRWAVWVAEWGGHDGRGATDHTVTRPMPLRQLEPNCRELTLREAISKAGNTRDVARQRAPARDDTPQVHVGLPTASLLAGAAAVPRVTLSAQVAHRAFTADGLLRAVSPGGSPNRGGVGVTPRAGSPPQRSNPSQRRCLPRRRSSNRSPARDERRSSSPRPGTASPLRLLHDASPRRLSGRAASAPAARRGKRASTRPRACGRSDLAAAWLLRAHMPSMACEVTPEATVVAALWGALAGRETGLFHRNARGVWEMHTHAGSAITVPGWTPGALRNAVAPLLQTATLRSNLLAACQAGMLARAAGPTVPLFCTVLSDRLHAWNEQLPGSMDGGGHGLPPLVGARRATRVLHRKLVVLTDLLQPCGSAFPHASVLLQSLYRETQAALVRHENTTADMLLELLNGALRPLLTAVGNVMHGVDPGPHLVEADGRVRWERGALPAFLQPLERTVASTGGTVQDIVRIDPHNPIFQRASAGGAHARPTLLGLQRARGGVVHGILGGVVDTHAEAAPMLRGLGVRVHDAVNVAEAIERVAQARADRVRDAEARKEELRRQKAAREAEVKRALEERAQRLPAVPPEWPGSRAYRESQRERQLAKKRLNQTAQREALDAQVVENDALRAAQVAEDVRMEVEAMSPRFTDEEIAEAKAALLEEYAVKMQAAEARQAELQQQLRALGVAPGGVAGATAAATQAELASLSESVSGLQRELEQQTTVLEGRRRVDDVASQQSEQMEVDATPAKSAGDVSMAEDDASEATEKQILQDQAMSRASNSPGSAAESHGRLRHRIADHPHLLGGGEGHEGPPRAGEGHPRLRHKIPDQPDLLKWEEASPKQKQRVVLHPTGPAAKPARPGRDSGGVPVGQRVGVAGGLVFAHQQGQAKRRLHPLALQAGRPPKQRCLPAVLMETGGTRTLYSHLVPSMGIVRCPTLPRSGLDEALEMNELESVQEPAFNEVDIYAAAARATQERRRVQMPVVGPPAAAAEPAREGNGRRGSEAREAAPASQAGMASEGTGLSTIARLDALYKRVCTRTERRQREASPPAAVPVVRASPLRQQRARAGVTPPNPLVKVRHSAPLVIVQPPLPAPAPAPAPVGDAKRPRAGVRALNPRVLWGADDGARAAPTPTQIIHDERMAARTAFVDALPFMFKSYRQRAPEELPASVWGCMLPLGVGFRCTLQRAVLSQQQEVDRAIQSATLSKARLRDTLAVLHAVYLALDCRFSNEVADVIDAAAAGRVSTVNARNRIQLALLALEPLGVREDLAALTSLYAIDVLPDIYVSSGGQAAQAGRNEHAENYIQLQFAPPERLRHIITETHLRIYQKVHRLLLALRSAVKVSTGVLRVCARSRRNDASVRALSALRYEVQRMLHGLLTYLSDGLRAGVMRLSAVLGDSKHPQHPTSIPGYRTMHAAFVEGVQEYVMLSPTLRPQYKRFRDIIRIAFELPSLVHSTLPSLSAVQALHRDFKQSQQYIIESLIVMRHGAHLANIEGVRPSASRAATSDVGRFPGHAQWAGELLARLDPTNPASRKASLY